MLYNIHQVCNYIIFTKYIKLLLSNWSLLVVVQLIVSCIKRIILSFLQVNCIHVSPNFTLPLETSTLVLDKGHYSINKLHLVKTDE